MALNFADLFEHAADAFAERTAVACGDRQVSYRELDERTNRLAHHLAGLGVGPGDHVGLYARNSIGIAFVSAGDLLGQRVAALVQLRPGAPGDLAALQEHVRGQIAGYKVPRSIWLVDAIRRTVSGKADYGWARQYAAGHPPGLDRPFTPWPPGQPAGKLARRMTMRTALCDLLGIEHPIVGFSPSEHVAAAVSRAGGLGVLGCVRFNDPAELDATLDWMDSSTDGRPYGIDVVMPARVPAEGAARDLDQMIPRAHKDFVEQTLLKLGVPPLPDGAQAADGVLGWLHSVARKQVEVADEALGRLNGLR
jgi:AMP-binding enzyme/AMP-binding enzyme C-terminal domain